MSSRAHRSSAPGSRGGRAGHRPRSGPPTARRTPRTWAATDAPAATGTPSTSPSPSPSKAKLTGRAAVLVLVVAVLAVSYASSVRAWVQQRSDINTLTAEIADRQAEVAALKQTRQRWHDPAYIRTQARSRFGWLMPGETGYRVINDNGDILVAGSQLSDPVDARPTSTPEWWETAWGSVVAAGRDPAEVAAAAARKAASRPTPLDQIGGRPAGRTAPYRDERVDRGYGLVPESGQGRAVDR